MQSLVNVAFHTSVKKILNTAVVWWLVIVIMKRMVVESRPI